MTRPGRPVPPRPAISGFRGVMTQNPARHGAVLAALEPVFQVRLSTSPVLRALHTAAESWLPPSQPDAVVLAKSTEEVSLVLSVCNAQGVPVVPFGAGSPIEGQVNAPQGGISLDFSAMDRVLALHPEDMDCAVQPASPGSG